MSKSKLQIEGAERISVTEVVVKSRQRDKTKGDVRKHIEQLAESIKLHGLICPIVLDENNELIAGECRLEAHILLDKKEISYVRRSSLNESEKILLEVEENHRRLDMTWQEKVLGMYHAHKALLGKASKTFEKWGLKATGELIGASTGSVSDALKLSGYLLSEDKDVWAAPSMEKAKSVIEKRKLHEISKIMAERTGVVSTPAKVVKAEGITSISLLTGNVPAAKSETAPIAAPTPTRHIDLSQILYHGDNRAVFQTLGAGIADIIFTDIPYGIDMNDLEGLQNLDSVEAEHDVDENVEQMPDFINNAYKALKDDGWLLFFYALQHHEKLRDLGEAAGFAVQPWPLLWIKPNSNKNQAPQARWTKNYEPCMVMRKGRATLLHPVNESTFTCDGSADRKLQNNPFAKPFEFIKWALHPILRPGATVLDCYAGQGSIVRACIGLGAKPIAIEKKELHFQHLTAQTKMTYRNLFGQNTEFTNPV
jgi:DNA modification methylase